MKKLILLTIIGFVSIFGLSGCGGTTVKYVEVPGPTKIEYKQCEELLAPEKPKYFGKMVSFKKISFNDQVFYGITESEAIDLSVNIMQKDSYIEELQTLTKKIK